MTWFNKKTNKELAIETKKDLEEISVAPSNAGKPNITETIKHEFVAIVAHQLRTPIADIKWSLRMLLDGDFGAISEKQKEVLEKAYEADNEAIKLISDILNVARIEEGKFLSLVMPQDIEEIISESLKIYSQEIESKNIKIEFVKFSENLPKAMIDREKMKIAFENILDNAVKYTPSNGKIKISAMAKGNDLEIQVQDTGIGIPENKQKEIFNKFFRAENAMRQAPGGSGLGLFITKYIIEAHGGKIWFKSKEGEGTIFYFTIPIGGVK